MKKRGISVLLIVMLTMQLLVGCSLGKAPATNGDNKGGGGKGGDGVLQIGAVVKGYGSEYIKQLAAAYEKKTGVKTILAKESSDESAIRTTLQAGPKSNELDLIFDIWPKAMGALAKSNYVTGYERAFLPLSDIYNEKLEGYDQEVTLMEMITPYAKRAVTWGGEDAGYGDGEQYFVSTNMGMEGLVYNVDLFAKYNLEVPKTTEQFFALMNKMKTLSNGSYAKNDAGKEIYPYVYSGKASYSNFLGVVWWAQYEGIDAYNYALEGKDAKGKYTSDSVKAVGKLSAMTHISELLRQKNGYTNPSNYSQSFTNAQLLFLDNQAFMMSTGDWLEREMEGNFKGEKLNVAFMRIPVNSDIIMKCDTVKTEAQLVETIAYIDGETTTKPAYLSDKDLARITEARSVYCGEGNQHIAYIPVYSNMAEEAKDFLLFMMSKEGQEIMMKYCYGNTSPLKNDVTKMAGYNELSSLQKSKYDMLASSVGLNFVGNSYVHPMGYAGGIESFYNQPTFEAAFGVVESSNSYMTPQEIWENDYKNKKTNWNEVMNAAGLKDK